MKILVTSDNHLGYKETDPIRAEDTFNTLDEILEIALREKVDFIVQGGDFFHENKPSRNTYNKTMQILKKHCLGTSKPNFSANIRLNTDDPNMNVSLPIISIHGNHDDPSGFNSVSPHDILHSGGFINYIGKVEDVDSIELSPVLIKGPGNEKGIAIYGMGHIKDSRVYKTFMKGNVKYNRPEGDNWINIFVVHQNRAFRANEYLPEDFINSFFDVVIYGHEHESIKIPHKNFEVVQCGSTVRTSLCEGEAGDKFVYIFDTAEELKISRIKLETVRPFVMNTIKINNNTKGIITSKVEELLDKCKGYTILPLLRLRIDIEGDVDINKYNIQILLESKIANPNEALRISRKIQKEVVKSNSIVQKTDFESIFKNILDGCGLKALNQGRIIEALQDFLNKDNKDAFGNLIKDGVKNIIDCINLDDLIADSIDDAIKNARYRINNLEDNEIFSSNENSSIENVVENNCNENVTNTSIINMELYKTVPLPQESVSFQNSSLINTKSINSKSEFTFIEDKIENIKTKEIMKNVHKELDETVKKTKIEDDFDELFGFTKFM